MASMRTAPTSAPSAATTGTPPATACEIELWKILYIHTTPYSVDGWTAALLQCNILEDFLNLAHDIKLGSPIGNPPPLTSTFLPRNLPSATLYPELIDKEILEETLTGQMSGPFTVADAHVILNGHFRMSPVGLIEKHPGTANGG